MRIAVITPGFAKNENDYGGAAVFNNFIKELSSRNGMDVSVFALYYPEYRAEYKFFNATVFSFSKGSQKRIAKPGIWNRCKKKFAEEHNRKKFNIIHALWCGESGYIASQLGKTHGIPMAASICGGELAGIKSINYGSQLKFRQSYFVKKTIEQTQAIIAGSDYIIDKLNTYKAGKFAHKSVKIPFGVDSGLFFPSPPHPGKPGSFPLSFRRGGAKAINLLSIANAVPVKSHIDLFKAFKIVLEKFPDAKLTCCGRDDKNVLKKMTNEMRLNNNIDINGFVDYESLPSILNESDLFVLSSLYESQNMALIEAAFCGLPVVSTDAGIAREITKYISEPGNHEQLAEKILQVLSGYEKIKADAEAKVPELKEKYSVSACVDEYIKLYGVYQPR